MYNPIYMRRRGKASEMEETTTTTTTTSIPNPTNHNKGQRKEKMLAVVSKRDK